MMTDSRKKRTIPFAVYIYTITYSVFVLLIPVIYQNKSLAKILPPFPNTLSFIIGYVIGIIGVIFLALIAVRATLFISGLFIGFVLFSSLYINAYNFLYNDSIRIPYIFIVEPGDISDLAAQRWKREISFDVYYSIYQEYKLKNVYLNPEIPNAIELGRIDRFGVYTILTNEVPSELPKPQFLKIKNNPDLNFKSIWHNDIEYLIYASDQEVEDILLISYRKKILFLPISLISE